MAAQTFIRWSRLGVWDRLLAVAQERGVELGMAFLDSRKLYWTRVKGLASGEKRGVVVGKRSDGAVQGWLSLEYRQSGSPIPLWKP